MASSKTTWKFDADPSRQAIDSWRGYVYQAWQALLAWLELREEDVLYLEGAEDFDIISPDSGVPVQVKDTSANITLRTDSVLSAISSFWRLRQTHQDKTITFNYLTRSSIGTEQGSPFGEGEKGLNVWSDCHRDNTETIMKLADFLTDDAVASQKLPEDLIDTLKAEEPHKIYDFLISRVRWLTETPPVKAVTVAIDSKLIMHGNRMGVPPSECTKVTDRLLREVLTVACQKEYGSRRLDYARFAQIFEDVTSVRIPRHNLQKLMAIQEVGAQMVANLHPGVMVSFDPLTHILSAESPPPLPPQVAPRHALVESCQKSLQQDDILIITASTGTGKTTLAKLIARAHGGEWAWFTFSPFHGERFTWALAQAAQQIDNMPQNINLVLDDLPFEPGTVNKWEYTLAGLIYTIRARQSFLVITSRKSVPSRFRNLLGSLITPEVSVHGFDKHEIKQLCIQLGCHSEQAENQANVVYFQTAGHPQLVHARLLTISRKGWPRISAESLFKTPQDIKEQRQQARQLLETLTNEEKDLLYCISVALAPFRREHIVLLGEYVNLSHPGDLFDRLVGPWIERTAGNQFELSPLLNNAGKDVWSQSKIESIHSHLSDAIITAGELSIVEGSHALFHAFVGKNKQVLTGLGISLTTRSSDQVLKAFGESAFWFLGVCIEEESGPLFTGDQLLSLILRMAQFRLCVAAEPDKAYRVLNAWEREVALLDNSFGNLLAKMYFYFSGLLYVQAPIPLRRVVLLFKEIASLRKDILNSGHNEMMSTLPLTQIDNNGETANLLATLFGLNARRCQDKQDFDECLQGLSELDEELRQELLEAFELPDGYASVYVESVFLSEFNAEHPNWNECLAVLSKAMDYAVEWKSPSLGASAVRVCSVILDEHLDRREDALSILKKGAERFPSHSWIIEEQLGNIFLNDGKYSEAVSIFVRTLEGVDDDHAGIFHRSIFIFRNAGIAAANDGQWELAARFFQRGHRRALALDDSVMAAAFQTDAAFAYWKAGQNQAMLDSFRESVALIDAMGRSKKNLGQFWVFRITAHNIVWIRSIVEDGHPQPGLATPIVGMCSNPERNEKILALPDIPFEFTLYFLIRIEQLLKAEPLTLELYRARLETIKIATIQLFMVQLRIQETFLSESFDQLPGLIGNLVRAYIASKMIASAGKDPWIYIEKPVSEDQVRKTLLDEDMLIKPFLAALLWICQLTNSDTCLEHIQKWRKSAALLSWGEDLGRFLDYFKTLQDSSVSELCVILRNKESNQHNRLVASVVWERRSNSLPESSADFYSNNDVNCMPHLIFLHLIP